MPLILCRCSQGMQLGPKTSPTMVPTETPEKTPQQQAAPTKKPERAFPREAESSGNKYLIGSFPTEKVVAYSHLPEKIWRPLPAVTLGQPTAIAIDRAERWMYVSDIATGRIWRYTLKFKKDGTMETSSTRMLVVDGHVVKWMTVDSTGDLFFTGHEVGSGTSQDVLYKSEKKMTKFGFTVEPIRYSGFNEPNAPNESTPLDATGITSDGNDIYWGRREQGFHHGSICKGVLAKNDAHLDDMEVTPLLNATEDVKGLAVTKEKVFFVADVGVYGISKGWTLQKPALVAENVDNKTWLPKSILWDTEGTMYVTDTDKGAVYTFSSRYSHKQNVSKYVDAPGIDSIAFFKASAQCTMVSTPIVYLLLAVITAFVASLH